SPAPKSCFNALATAANTTNPFAEANSNVVFAGGNASLSKVVISSTTALTSQAVPTRGNLYERSAAAPGTLELVSVLPNGNPAANALLGGGPTRNVEHAVSEDGSHVFFEGNEAAKETTQHLYMRDTALGKTVQIDAQQPGVTIPAGLYPEPPAAYETANFATASADGSIVYFTDQWRLTPDSQAGPGQLDLYACHIEVSEGSPKCKLTDLTVSANAEERGGVQGVLGAGST